MNKVALVIVGGTALLGVSVHLAGCEDSSSSSSSSSSGSTLDASSGGSSGTGSSSGGSSSGGSSGTTSGGITLTAADKDGVTPCPVTDPLANDTLLATVKSAMTGGSLTYLDIPFDGSDPDIYKKKCGLEGFWDPTQHTDTIPSTGTPTILELVQFGNSGICSQGFATMVTDDGFPVAGVYRKDFKATAGADTFNIRARVTTSGTAAGKKFSDIPLTVAELASKLTYQVNGTAAPHADVWASLVNAFKAPAPSATLDAQNAGTTIFTAKIELICGLKQ